MDYVNLFQKAPYHWWQIFKIIRYYFETLQCIWQRATKGYCFRDIWDLDEYLLYILHHTINNLADTTHGYPGNFRAPTDWELYLKEMAQHFHNSSEYTNDVEEAKNIYKDWLYNVKGFNNFKVDNIQKEKYRQREKEIYQWRQSELEKGFKMLQERFRDLWD